MEACRVSDLERSFQNCSDCILHPDYTEQLKKLDTITFTQELVDYLCEKATSKKHIWEIRFEHLRLLLCNPSSQAFDLKNFYFTNLQKSRRPAMKIFWIRGYAIYASEKELEPIMDRFCKILDGPHGTADINYILSVAGLPYLVKTYGYPCFARTLEKAEETRQRIHPLLRDFYTLDENMRQVDLLSPEESARRTIAFLEERKASS